MAVRVRCENKLDKLAVPSVVVLNKMDTFDVCLLSITSNFEPQARLVLFCADGNAKASEMESPAVCRVLTGSKSHCRW